MGMGSLPPDDITGNWPYEPEVEDFDDEITQREMINLFYHLENLLVHLYHGTPEDKNYAENVWGLIEDTYKKFYGDKNINWNPT